MIINSLNFPVHKPQNDAVLFSHDEFGHWQHAKEGTQGMWCLWSAAPLVQLCPALAVWGPLLSGLFFGKSPLRTPPFPLKLSDAFSPFTPYATSLWYKTGLAEQRLTFCSSALLLDDFQPIFGWRRIFCLLGNISVSKLKKIFLSHLWMFKLTFQWFLTFLSVPDLSR